MVGRDQTKNKGSNLKKFVIVVLIFGAIITIKLCWHFIFYEDWLADQCAASKKRLKTHIQRTLDPAVQVQIKQQLALIDQLDLACGEESLNSSKASASLLGILAANDKQLLKGLLSRSHELWSARFEERLVSLDQPNSEFQPLLERLLKAQNTLLDSKTSRSEHDNEKVTAKAEDSVTPEQLSERSAKDLVRFLELRSLAQQSSPDDVPAQVLDLMRLTSECSKVEGLGMEQRARIYHCYWRFAEFYLGELCAEDLENLRKLPALINDQHIELLVRQLDSHFQSGLLRLLGKQPNIQSRSAKSVSAGHLREHFRFDGNYLDRVYDWQVFRNLHVQSLNNIRNLRADKLKATATKISELDNWLATRLEIPVKFYQPWFSHHKLLKLLVRQELHEFAVTFFAVRAQQSKGEDPTHSELTQKVWTQFEKRKALRIISKDSIQLKVLQSGRIGLLFSNLNLGVGEILVDIPMKSDNAPQTNESKTEFNDNE